MKKFHDFIVSGPGSDLLDLTQDMFLWIMEKH